MPVSPLVAVTVARSLLAVEDAPSGAFFYDMESFLDADEEG